VPHPIALDALAELRNKHTLPAAFRVAAHRLSTVVVTEALRDLATAPVAIETPLRPATVPRVRDGIVLVPVLRAGLGMLDAALTLVPSARVGYIGMRRDEDTALPSHYYARVPEGLQDSVVALIDPMLATGGSASAALDLLKAAGARNLRLVCLVAAPEGVAALERAHPDVDVYTPALDDHLNDRKFIVPGLGDFGDRLFGTA
jgi:uracil phosphoribosyltransferase